MTDDVITHLVDQFWMSTLESLSRTQEWLRDKVKLLYELLNIEESFPERQDINLNFVRLLVLVHNLRINIQEQAIGSFFEWDRLDQAVGGHNQAIGSLCLYSFSLYSLTCITGTKIHQSTQDAIAKWKPALLKVI